MRILLADSFPLNIINDLKRLGVELDVSPELEGESLLSKVKDFSPDVLVVRSTKVFAEVLQNGSIFLVIRAGAGVNNIDIKTAAELGIYVANCPGKNAIAVAEMTMGLLIALDRHIVDATIDLKSGKWNKKLYSKAQGLYGKTLGVIGVGEIGKELIKRAKGFGLEVVAWSRSLDKAKAKSLGVVYIDTPLEVARNSDIVSLHIALTSETKGMFDKEFFAAMKPNSYLINTSRGDLIVEDDLLKAIEEKNIWVGCDVWIQQPAQSEAEFSSKLLLSSHVYGTPHIGASTDQAQLAVAEETFRIIKTFKEKGVVLNCVNILKESTVNTLVIRHANKVGVLADVFEHIKTENINILEMQNTLFNEEISACATIHLSDVPSENLITHLKSHEHIFSVEKN